VQVFISAYPIFTTTGRDVFLLTHKRPLHIIKLLQIKF